MKLKDEALNIKVHLEKAQSHICKIFVDNGIKMAHMFDNKHDGDIHYYIFLTNDGELSSFSLQDETEDFTYQVNLPYPLDLDDVNCDYLNGIIKKAMQQKFYFEDVYFKELDFPCYKSCRCH